MNENYLFTSESVTEGHPDKVSDRISDTVLDCILEQDPDGRVACETMITGSKDKSSLEIFISGEITTDATVDYDNIVKSALNHIGYLEDYNLTTLIKPQSLHIAQGVDEFEGHNQGAGDQGLMFGFACNETSELMPLPIVLSHRLVERLTEVRKNKKLDWLCPDGKSQVTIEYNSKYEPTHIRKIVIATQHQDMLDKFDDETLEHNFIKKNIIEHVIIPTVEKYNIPYDDSFIVNGTGRFVEGGPIADVGLTGRKIIVDTYGGAAPHGGGAFSGKDPTKVDRSAAYASRYLAKNVVASNITNKCLIQLAYAIGVSKPLSIYVDLFSNDEEKNRYVEKLIKDNFDLSPRGIREMLGLNKPIYEKTAAYGHFGRDPESDGAFSWEKTDKTHIFSK